VDDDSLIYTDAGDASGIRAIVGFTMGSHDSWIDINGRIGNSRGHSDESATVELGLVGLLPEIGALNY